MYRHTPFGSAAPVSCLNWHTGASLRRCSLVQCEQTKAEKWRAFAVPIMQGLCVKRAIDTTHPITRQNGYENCYFRVKRKVTQCCFKILFSEVLHYFSWKIYLKVLKVMTSVLLKVRKSNYCLKSKREQSDPIREVTKYTYKFVLQCVLQLSIKAETPRSPVMSHK